MFLKVAKLHAQCVGTSSVFESQKFFSLPSGSSLSWRAWCYEMFCVVFVCFLEWICSRAWGVGGVREKMQCNLKSFM